LSTLCSFGHILEIFQAAVFAIFFIVDDVLNRVCTYLYDLSSQKASLIQFQYIFTYRHQVALLISRSCHSVFLRPTEFFFNINCAIFEEPFLFLIPQSFDWLAAFHLDLLQAIIFNAV